MMIFRGLEAINDVVHITSSRPFGAHSARVETEEPFVTSPHLGYGVSGPRSGIRIGFEGFEYLIALDSLFTESSPI